MPFVSNCWYLSCGIFKNNINEIENDAENPDFITGNQISRIGILENPKSFNSNEILTLDNESAIKKLEEADLIVGHNIIKFDIPVLQKLYNFNFWI